jgi:hypothetical protein
MPCLRWLGSLDKCPSRSSPVLNPQSLLSKSKSESKSGSGPSIPIPIRTFGVWRVGFPTPPKYCISTRVSIHPFQVAVGRKGFEASVGHRCSDGEVIEALKFAVREAEQIVHLVIEEATDASAPITLGLGFKVE